MNRNDVSSARPFLSFARPVLGAVVVCGLLVGWGGAPIARAARPVQTGGVTYRLVDTWQKKPWTLTAGRYGQTQDISSTPDGTTFVLDSRHGAVHVLAPDGTPERVFVVDPTGEWSVERLDAGWDDTIYVLSDGKRGDGDAYLSRIDQFTRSGARVRPNGTPLLAVELTTMTPNAYKDLAIRPDGRIYLSRSGPTNPFVQFPGPTPTSLPPGSPPLNAIDVLGPDGVLQTRFGTEHLCMPDSLDMAQDGTLYVVSQCPSPFGSTLPGPTPTPRPSIRPDASQWRAAPDQATPVPPDKPEDEGIIVFNPDHSFKAKHKFTNAEDIAVGLAGVFVSRNLEIFALDDKEPLYTGQAGQFYTSLFDEVVFRLDVPAAGGMQASMNHCFFQGVIRFPRTTDRPATGTLRGELDQPELEGPAYPLRISAGDDVAVLQGRFAITGAQPLPQFMLMPYYGEQQVVQRWHRDGTLPTQLGLCSEADGAEVGDVAMDGPDIYTIDQDILQLRPDNMLPAWSFWPGADNALDVTSRLLAVSAQGGRAALLDAGADRVLIVDRAKNVVASWPISSPGLNADPVDLALFGDRVYLADNGRSRVIVRTLTGDPVAEWPLYEGALGIATGPTGDVFVLGRGGWGYRYRPDGTLMAMWAMPDPNVEALDLAVGPDERVYVNFVQRVPLGNGQSRGADFVDLPQAGVWVFAAVDTPPVPPPAPSACLAWPDKRAAPGRIPLGQQVDVTLEVHGRCPGRYDPAQVAVVFDTSRSMNFDNVIQAARSGAMDLVAQLDPRTSQAALITFDEAAALKQPLTGDVASVRTKIAALEGWGDTRMSTGIEAARLELTGVRKQAGARQMMVVVTDGVINDDPAQAVQAALADGIDLYFLVYSTWEFQPSDHEELVTLAGADDHVLMAPLPTQLTDLVHDLVNYRAEAGLFDTITINDVIPANMRYVAGSARPPAALQGNTLVWTLDAIQAARPITLTYRLQPLEVGTWPTNVQATADYTDALKQGGHLIFPIPTVEVYAPEPAKAIYLPYASKGQCVKPERPLDVALVLDTSSSMTEADPGGGTKLAAAQAAARTFLRLLRLPTDEAALITFNRTATRATDLTGDRAALDAALATLSTAQGTRIDLGLREAGAALAAGGRSGARPVVILLTDGIQSEGSEGDVLAQADALKATGALVYTIGLGGDVHPDLLRAVASSPDRYFGSPSAADLDAIYQQISERLACEQDARVAGTPVPSGVAGERFR